MRSLALKPIWARIFLVSASILSAVLGQTFLSRQEMPLAAVFYLAALATWLAAMLLHSTSMPIRPSLPARLGAPILRSRAARAALFVLGLLLAILTFLTSTNNTFTPLNLTLWLLSVLAVLLALLERRPETGPKQDGAKNGVEPDTAHSRQILPILLALFVIILLAAFFYYFRLDRVPAEMTSDHAEKLLDVNDLLNGKRPIFFPRNTGREPIEFYLVAAFINLVHNHLDFMALKWVTATIGFLTVPLVFLLARQLFDNLVGLLASAFTAVANWPVGISRMGLRFPLTPFFTALAFIFLFRALKDQRRNDFVLTGLALGAGLYGYHASKIVPFVAAACFVMWLLFEGPIRLILARRPDWRSLARYTVNVAITFTLALLVFVPLLRYMTDHPQDFWYRILTRISDEQRPIEGNPALVLADNVKNAALMFNVEGDRAWPNTLSNVPVLDEVCGGLFVLGVAYALCRLARYREAKYAYLLAALSGLLLPSALAIAYPIENPSVVRAGGAIPFAFILVALPLAQLARSLQAALPRAGNWLAVCAVGATILLAAHLNYTRYFELYDEQYRRASWNSSEVAATMLDFARNGGSLNNAWVVAFPHWVDTRNVAINLGNINWNNVIWRTSEIAHPAQARGATLFILSPKDTSNLQGLHILFPHGYAVEYHSRTPGKEYIGFYIPGELPRNSP